ncbi:transporter [Tianweitania sp. BSSL-BM11]|uniref:Transporter n=1 Tax=Tianweitania aestuarii TaxID=2814886 RepID=A0ABS5RQN0_9HYPH|nr:transporter [Tianweitania aestuarii]MBS9719350.1 transporter [Tianweitania aestuarii]
MLSGEAIQNSVAGAWSVMLGRKDALNRLDVSADGFWDSFWAIPLTLPPLLLAWVTSAAMLTEGGIDQSKLSIVLRLAFVDFANWLVPLIALALIARPIGISKRFAPYVVVSNWGTLIMMWLGLPIMLMSLFSPDSRSFADVLGFMLFLASLLFSWRITQASLNTEVGTTIAVFVGMTFLSILLVILLQPMLGLTIPA